MSLYVVKPVTIVTEGIESPKLEKNRIHMREPIGNYFFHAKYNPFATIQKKSLRNFVIVTRKKKAGTLRWVVIFKLGSLQL